MFFTTFYKHSENEIYELKYKFSYSFYIIFGFIIMLLFGLKF